METVTFALHPDRVMKLVYLQNLDHSSVENLSTSVSTSEGASSYALIRAKNVVSLSQMQAAANMALLRCIENKASPARETVVCAAGSSNPTHAVRNCGLFLDGNNLRGEGKKEEGDMFIDVILIGFDCNDDDIMTVLKTGSINVDDHIRPFSSLQDRFYASNGSMNEELFRAIIKAYKLTREEIDAFGMEQSVIHRIATKFVS